MQTWQRSVSGNKSRPLVSWILFLAAGFLSPVFSKPNVKAVTSPLASTPVVVNLTPRDIRQRQRTKTTPRARWWKTLNTVWMSVSRIKSRNPLLIFWCGLFSFCTEWGACVMMEYTVSIRSIHQLCFQDVWGFSRFSFLPKKPSKIKRWNVPLLFFTLSYIKVRPWSPVRRGHNYLNDLSKWTMAWLHRTNWCHISCHRGSLGSHTPSRRRKRKMSPLTHFTKKKTARQFYGSPHPSLSISCLGDGGQAHFDPSELPWFPSRLLLGTAWKEWTSPSGV